MGLEPIFKCHGKRQSLWIEQCESMISFLSVNTNADAVARCEHSLTYVQELDPENNIFTYFLPLGKRLGPPNTGLNVSSVFHDILNCPHPWNISEMSLRLILFRVKFSSFRHEIFQYWWEIRISCSEWFFSPVFFRKSMENHVHRCRCEINRKWSCSHQPF